MSIAADSRIVLNLIGKVGCLDCIVLISQSGHCPSSNESETTPHMLISCSSLALVWSELQSFHPLNVDSVKDLLEKLFRQDSLYNVVIIVLLNIWKRKNSKVSRDVFEELHITASKIADD